MNIWKKFAAVAALAVPLVLAGCGQPATQLCPTDQPGIGESSVAQIFNGASGAHKVCNVQGADLQANGNYAFDNGLLVIDGNVPTNAKINVSNGKLYVSGNIEQGAKIKAEVPEVHSSYTTTALIPIFNGKTTMLIPTTQTHYKFEHFKYQNDTDPAVIVDGSVEDSAKVTSNHDIHVSNGYAETAKFYNSQSAHKSKTYQGGGTDNYYVAPIVR